MILQIITAVTGSSIMIWGAYQLYRLGYKHSKENRYEIKDLQIGGNCGCCGEWVGNIILEKDWPVTICKECEKLT